MLGCLNTMFANDLAASSGLELLWTGMTVALFLLCRFSSVLQGLYKSDNLTLFAIDEAHCISR